MYSDYILILTCFTFVMYKYLSCLQFTQLNNIFYSIHSHERETITFTDFKFYFTIRLFHNIMFNIYIKEKSSLLLNTKRFAQVR